MTQLDDSKPSAGGTAGSTCSLPPGVICVVPTGKCAHPKKRTLPSLDESKNAGRQICGNCGMNNTLNKWHFCSYEASSAVQSRNNTGNELNEILNSLSDSSASRGWLDCKSGSEDTHPRNDLVQTAKAKLTKCIEQEIKKELTRLLPDGTLSTSAYALWVQANIEKRIRELGES